MISLHVHHDANHRLTQGEGRTQPHGLWTGPQHRHPVPQTTQDHPHLPSPSASPDSTWGFPGGSEDKESTCNAGDTGLIPGWEDSPEKELATHSNIPAWRIPWTEEPGGLQSTWTQRVRQD